MSEMNPHHAVTGALRDQWHKIVVLLMVKQGVTEVVITPEDLEKLVQSNCRNITIQELHDGVHLRLVDDTTAVTLAKKEGGLPQ